MGEGAGFAGISWPLPIEMKPTDRISQLPKVPLIYIGSLLCALTMAVGQSNEAVVAPAPPFEDNNTTVTGNLAGICAVVRKEPDSDNVLIAEVLPEQAADKASLRANDRIVEIEGQSIKGLDLKDVVALLRGQPGTQVKLSVIREEVAEPMDFTVTRELVRLKEVPSN